MDGFENHRVHENSVQKRMMEKKKILVGSRLVSREGGWIKGEGKKKKGILWINKVLKFSRCKEIRRSMRRRMDRRERERDDWRERTEK